MVEWTAPESGTGTITFYSCGNGVNANNESGGDNSDCTQLELTEGDPSSSNNLAEKVALNVFPNPVDAIINLEINSEVSGTFDVRIYNLYGQMVKTDQINLAHGENREFINVNDLSQGNYLLQITDGEQMTSKKILKL